jgi:hypothetical protein
MRDLIPDPYVREKSSLELEAEEVIEAMERKS